MVTSTSSSVLCCLMPAGSANGFEKPTDGRLLTPFHVVLLFSGKSGVTLVPVRGMDESRFDAVAVVIGDVPSEGKGGGARLALVRFIESNDPLAQAGFLNALEFAALENATDCATDVALLGRRRTVG